MQTGKDAAWTVIGAGFGGKGIVAHLGSAGFRLRIHDVDEEKLAPIRSAGGVRVEGAWHGLAPVEMTTSDLALAVEGAAVILVCVYGTEHEAVATLIAPHLRDGQIVLLVQGHFCGAMLFRRALEAADCAADVDIAEMDAYPYMVGLLGPDRIEFGSVKRWWQLASYPGKRAAAILERIGIAFPGMVASPNLLHTAFVDFGGVFHVAGMVTNVGRVESDEPYHFYADNMVPSVCNLIEALDQERVAVARAYNVAVADVRSWIAETYGLRNPDLHDSMQEMASSHYLHAPSPKSLLHRYFLQDLSCIVVGIASLGCAASVPTPVSASVIEIGGALLKRNLWREGRNLRRLRLDGKSVNEIIKDITG